MYSLFKLDKNLAISLIFFLIVIPLFGFKFLISFLGNILLILILIPILIVLVTFIGFNSFKSNLNTCESCGTISLSLNNKCVNCGADLAKNFPDNVDKASESTIEVKAEEIN